jgi:hypothetical protein
MTPADQRKRLCRVRTSIWTVGGHHTSCDVHVLSTGAQVPSDKHRCMYEVAEKALDIEAAARGARGRFLGCRWLSLRMRQLVREHYNGTKYAVDKVRDWWLAVCNSAHLVPL